MQNLQSILSELEKTLELSKSGRHDTLSYLIGVAIQQAKEEIDKAEKKLPRH